MPDYLRFGIPSLDKLIGTHKNGKDTNYGIALPSKNEIDNSTGVCIIGPDGTGKSVFALHLASQYWADCFDEKKSNKETSLPKIFYISTDLNHEKAGKTWGNLALNNPFQKQFLFETLKYKNNNTASVKLEHYTPQTIIKYIKPDKRRATTRNHEICFIDLAAETAGDDWGFITRLLALLETPKKGEPRHLVIIDAVEGIETYMGKLDAFGEPATRRGRIAHLSRLTAKKAHLLLIVEEARTMERLPEEFVTDTVIRLRNMEVNKYLRRTLEIEKTRGQSHVRGQHAFTIRKGEGSKTGSQQNADDPEVESQNNTSKFQGYVQVFQSLSSLNRAIMEGSNTPRLKPPEDKFAAFGIRYLDNMLGGKDFDAVSENGGTDTRGLPCSTVTALIGDSLTQKSHLGRAFLSRGFNKLKETLEEDKTNDYQALKELTKVLETYIKEKNKQVLVSGKWETLIAAGDSNTSNSKELLNYEELCREVKCDWKAAFRDKEKLKIISENKIYKALDNCGVAVLFTTQDTHHEALAKEFIDEWLMIETEGLKNCDLVCIESLVESRIICRRMEVHDVSSATLAHIFKQNIAKAQRIALNKNKFDENGREEQLPDDIIERFKESGKIRVVIDDFNSFRNTYPEVREDPLFLPYLLFYLGREGVTMLIVDTQSISRPDLALTERYESTLRELVQHRLYTWRVSFYGENRVAVTAIPPFSPSTSGAIRELRWETREKKSNRTLEVSPHFELYRGLEEGNPKPVPLEIRFNASIPSFEEYIKNEEQSFSDFFTPYKREGQEGKATVFFPYIQNQYQLMHDFATMQRGTRLNHTLILQVDEFWTSHQGTQGRRTAFRSQREYLTMPTWRKEEGRDAIADPYSAFQPNEIEKEVAKKNGQPIFKRLNFYKKEYEEYTSYFDNDDDERKNRIDRIPFSWDFGFLLCKGSAWKEVITQRKEKKDGKEKLERTKKVKEVWDKLTKATEEKKGNSNVSWLEFFEACKIVAENQSYKTSTAIRAFDLPFRSLESFACLLLEIWASEIYKNEKDKTDKKRGIETYLCQRQKIVNTLTATQTSIIDWLREERDQKLKDIINSTERKGYSIELYKTWLLLTEVIDFASLTTNPDTVSFDFRQKPVGTSAVASRHWYKSACEFTGSLSHQDLEADWIPIQLPGHFSTRGDWFLVVAGGSRSNRLADRALDLLSTKRANITRLQEGIGLPVRILFDKKEKNRFRTHLLAINKNQITNVLYKDLLDIAPRNDKEFFCLWRSNLKGYDRDIRIWHKWLNMMIHWWSSLHHKDASNWTDGFTVCKWIDDKNLEELENLESWRTFDEWRDMLIDSFEQVYVDSE